VAELHQQLAEMAATTHKMFQTVGLRLHREEMNSETCTLLRSFACQWSSWPVIRLSTLAEQEPSHSIS